MCEFLLMPTGCQLVQVTAVFQAGSDGEATCVQPRVHHPSHHSVFLVAPETVSVLLPPITVPLPQGSQREKPGRSIPVFIARNGSTKGHIQTAQLGARGPVQSSPTRYCSARGVAWFCSWRTMPRSSLYHQYPGQQLLTH